MYFYVIFYWIISCRNITTDSIIGDSVLWNKINSVLSTIIPSDSPSRERSWRKLCLRFARFLFWTVASGYRPSPFCWELSCECNLDVCRQIISSSGREWVSILRLCRTWTFSCSLWPLSRGHTFLRTFIGFCRPGALFLCNLPCRKESTRSSTLLFVVLHFRRCWF